MSDIKYIIDYIYNLTSTTYLTFGNFSFSIFSMWVCLFGISITSWAVYKIFDR